MEPRLGMVQKLKKFLGRLKEGIFFPFISTADYLLTLALSCVLLKLTLSCVEGISINFSGLEKGS